MSRYLSTAVSGVCLCGIVFVYPGAILATSSEQLINYIRLIGDRRELGGVLGGCLTGLLTRNVLSDYGGRSRLS